MSKIEKNAGLIACEMVKHNLQSGATSLNLDFIANDACELAYKIHELAEKYEHEEDDDKDIKEIIDRRIEKHLSKNITISNSTHAE